MTVLIACFMLTYTACKISKSWQPKRSGLEAQLATSRSVLPHPIRHRDYRSKPDGSPGYIRHGNLPKHYNLDYIDVSPYENNPFRRLKYVEFDTEDIPVFLQKQAKSRVNNVKKTKAKKFDEFLEFDAEDIPLFLQKQSKNRVNNVDKTKAKKIDEFLEFDTEDIPLLLQKQSKKRLDKSKTKKFDKLLEFDTEDIPIFLQKQSKQHENSMDKTKTKKFDKLFDENGMLFLTQPENVEDRKLNKLLNKVVQYDVDMKNKFLRKPLTKVFKPEEIKRLEKIVRALDEDDEVSTMKTDFEFGELVQ